jgi:predicted dehydrogenase
MPESQTVKPGRRTFLKQFTLAATSATLGSFAAGVFPPPATNSLPAGPRPDEKKVRIGIVGGGFGSSFQWHLHPQCLVTALCDLRDDRLKRLTEVYGSAATFKNFRDFLKHPQLDAVAVFTPAPLHVWMATEAMKAGKHVISAVPAGMSVEELEQLLECVKTTGLQYMMAETSFYRPEIITCREWSRKGQFGTLFYSEAEYHHEGLIPLMFDDRGFPTWRHGFPPMHYPTHCTGMVVPVTGERLVEVQAIGWGDGHEILQTNQYRNPFWNTSGFFKTSKGRSSRISVFWHVAAGGTERGQFYGDRLSYIMERPEKSPNTVIRISKGGKTILDANGYPEGEVSIESYAQPNHWEKLPQPLRVESGHGGSHTFITHEFISAIVEERHPEVNVWEAIAYTLPGIIAHQSALKGGEPMKIRDYGKAPVCPSAA